MSKRSIRRRALRAARKLPASPENTPATTPSRWRQRRAVTVAAGILVCLLTVVGVAGGWRAGGWRGVLHTLTGSAPAEPLQSSSNLSAANPAKEYIYAGGRLIATEEAGGATPTPSDAPSNLAATAASSTSIYVTWTAPASGGGSYRIERTASINNPFVELATTGATNFNDTNVTPGAAYLYRVLAVSSTGAVSAPSNTDLATAYMFADDPLTTGVTPARAMHIGELRQATGAVRALAGVAAAGWTDAALTGLPIRAVHIQELRTNLDEALTRLGLPVSAYSDAQLAGARIRRIHIEELRQRVK